jgi:hypothetical protein
MMKREAILAIWNCEEGFPPMPPTYPLEAVRGREKWIVILNVVKDLYIVQREILRFAQDDKSHL